MCRVQNTISKLHKTRAIINAHSDYVNQGPCFTLFWGKKKNNNNPCYKVIVDLIKQKKKKKKNQKKKKEVIVDLKEYTISKPPMTC